ncbi:ADP-ribosylglycohydrolase family protein [Candidatus Poriferisodalis sp.]|uniref:ADP-ribosylglycohydrolase family protein n=1 Tax=Candidatus Poriferisodalis sp. TaxID=3101277 RepID=UPI003B011C93
MPASVRIAAVQPRDGLGRIGIAVWPAAQEPHHEGGTRARDLLADLDSDLDAVQQWGATAVISLNTDQELHALGADRLPAAVQDRHMEWWHAPVPDGCAPGAGFERVWNAADESAAGDSAVGDHADRGRAVGDNTVGGAVRDRLELGFDVLVHCEGGLDRAATVASRLLVELGEPADDAIQRVRESHSLGAIETEEQQAHVRHCQPLSRELPSGAAEAVEDRAVGALLGLAVGDALGTTLEFCLRDSAPRLVDMIGGGPFDLAPGYWTDDTAMALALADSLRSCGTLDCEDLMERFTSWWHHGEYSCTGHCFDIGTTTWESLERYGCTGDLMAGSTDPHSAGNGSLMRLAPIVLRYWDDRAGLDRFAASQSRTTHGAAEAVDACRAFAGLLADAIAGMPRREVLARRTFSGAPAIQRVLGGSWHGAARDEIRSSGYVVDTLEAALWSVARTADFRSAVLLAANLADDADTVAAVTGQLAGALYGLSGIPTEWLGRVAWKERLLDVARQLVQQRSPAA